MVRDTDGAVDIFAEAEAEVAKEQAQQDKARYKAQLRVVAAAESVLANAQRDLEVLRRSLEG